MTAHTAKYATMQTCVNTSAKSTGLPTRIATHAPSPTADSAASVTPDALASCAASSKSGPTGSARNSRSSKPTAANASAAEKRSLASSRSTTQTEAVERTEKQDYADGACTAGSPNAGTHATDTGCCAGTATAPVGNSESALISEVEQLRAERDALLEALQGVINQRHDATVTLPARADEMVRLARAALRACGQ